MHEKKDSCCSGRFPTFAVIVLLVGVAWLLSEWGIFTFNIPWIPVILIIVAIGWIIGHYRRK